MRTIRLSLGLLILVAVVGGCGGSKKTAVLGVSRTDWTAGKRLGTYGILGKCASAAGPKRKVLVVCHSTDATAFSVSCWTPYGGSTTVLDEQSWVDAGSDPDCRPAEQVVAAARLLPP